MEQSIESFELSTAYGPYKTVCAPISRQPV